MRSSAPFSTSDEQRALRNAVADVLARHSDEARVRALMATDTGFDPAVWRELAAMGLTGLLIGEQYGGAGAGPVEMGIAMEEMGRALLVGPFLSTAVLVPNLLAELDDAAECAAALPRIAAGDLIATVAFAENGSALVPARIATSAGAIGDAWHVTGYKHFVLDGQSANLLYVLADTDAGPAVFAVEAGAPGLDVTPLTTVDPTRKQCRLQLVDTPARLVGRPGAGVEAFTAALDRSAVALLSEQAGGARRASRRWPPTTPRPAISSVARSAASRRSSTCAPTCCWRPSRRCRRRASSPDRSPSKHPRGSLILLWRRRIARMRSYSWRRPTSRYTAESDSLGSIRRICICVGPAATPSSWAARRGTANAICSRSEHEL